MSLIVEDGTGLPNAESFISAADATAYFANRGNTVWAQFTTSGQEQALRMATDYMEESYRALWAGTRVTPTQLLSWPRYMVPMKDAPGGYGSWPAYYDYKSVPMLVARACAEFAVRTAAGPLQPDIGAQVTQKTIGPITVHYQLGARQSNAYRAIENLLLPVLARGPSALSVARA